VLPYTHAHVRVCTCVTNAADLLRLLKHGQVFYSGGEKLRCCTDPCNPRPHHHHLVTAPSTRFRAPCEVFASFQLRRGFQCLEDAEAVAGMVSPFLRDCSVLGTVVALAAQLALCDGQAAATLGMPDKCAGLQCPPKEDPTMSAVGEPEPPLDYAPGPPPMHVPPDLLDQFSMNGEVPYDIRARARIRTASRLPTFAAQAKPLRIAYCWMHDAPFICVHTSTACVSGAHYRRGGGGRPAGVLARRAAPGRHASWQHSRAWRCICGCGYKRPRSEPSDISPPSRCSFFLWAGPSAALATHAACPPTPRMLFRRD
jgi:hypothetical protein